MNDEIKEILEIFKQVDLEPEAGGCYNCPKKDKDKTCIGCLNNAKDKLLDYITNLQQELQGKDNIINDLKSSIADYQEAVGDYQDELKRKDNNWNELKKYLEVYNKNEIIKLVLDKMKEIENGK